MKTILFLMLVLISTANAANSELLTRNDLNKFERRCVITPSSEYQEWCSQNSWMIEKVTENLEFQTERDIRQRDRLEH